jgi:short-subunit dehydrogenase
VDVGNRVVVVTGASSGIGLATARAMAARGARTILMARTASALEAAARDIAAAGGRADVYVADLSDRAAVIRAKERISREVGTPDVIVNNAGAGRYLSIEETEPEEAVQMMAAPYFAAFFVTRAFITDMLERGSGHIVNLTSPASRIVWPGAIAYIATRWALEGFTWALEADLRGTGIKVSLVTAAKVNTPYFRHNPGSEERIPGVSRLMPTVSAEQVADAIVKAVERERSTVIVPPMLKALYAAHRISPRIVRRVVHQTGWRRPRHSGAHGAGSGPGA